MSSRRVAASAFFLLLAAFLVAVQFRGGRDWQLSWLIPAIAAWKFGLSNRNRLPQKSKALGLTVAVVVPVYNEDVAILRRTLLSLLTQTWRPASIHVVDDGSPSTEAFQLAQGLTPAFKSIGVDYGVTRRASNMGKREALAVGFQAASDADIYVCIDSDTLLSRTAIGYLVSPFADPRVTATTGIVLPSNHNRNILTRLMDLRYAGAFLFGRAAYSSLGSVLCCSGAFSAFRGPVVRKHLPDFLSQRSRGQRVTIGDDRRLTNYCLLEGRAVLERRAVAETTVPDRVVPYLQQQSRWNKSFVRESLWCVQHMPLRKPAFFLNMFEFTSWLLFTALCIPGIALVAHRGPHLLVSFALFSALMAYMQSTRYFEVTGVRHRSLSERAGVFLIAPMYGVVHLLLLVPLRFYSLLTLGSHSWGTRGDTTQPGSRDSASEATVDTEAQPRNAFTGTLGDTRAEPTKTDDSPMCSPGVASPISRPAPAAGGVTSRRTILQPRAMPAPHGTLPWNRRVPKEATRARGAKEAREERAALGKRISAGKARPSTLRSEDVLARMLKDWAVGDRVASKGP